MIVSHDAAIPLYMQVYNYVMDLIDAGKLKNGDKLPSQNKLAEICKVSVVTSRKALEQLAADEIITTKHGTGSFVTHSKLPEQIFAVGSFTEAARRDNRTPETRILSAKHIKANSRIASALNIQYGSEVLEIKRLRLLDGLECILERDYFGPRFFGFEKTVLENKSLLDTLSIELTVDQFTFNDFFGITYASADEAKLLGCVASTPLLRVSEIVKYEQDSVLQTVYYNEQAIRSDRYHYAIASTSTRAIENNH